MTDTELIDLIAKYKLEVSWSLASSMWRVWSSVPESNPVAHATLRGALTAIVPVLVARKFTESFRKEE